MLKHIACPLQHKSYRPWDAGLSLHLPDNGARSMINKAERFTAKDPKCPHQWPLCWGWGAPPCEGVLSTRTPLLHVRSLNISFFMKPLLREPAPHQEQNHVPLHPCGPTTRTGPGADAGWCGGLSFSVPRGTVRVPGPVTAAGVRTQELRLGQSPVTSSCGVGLRVRARLSQWG